MKTILFALLVLAVPAYANNGTGSPSFCQRHCGVDVPTVDPAEECPDLTCPDVTCGATDCSQTTVVVTPTPCFSTCKCEQEQFVPCRVKVKKGIEKVRCPRKATPSRRLLPLSEAQKHMK